MSSVGLAKIPPTVSRSAYKLSSSRIFENAELQGINTAFSKILLDESLYALRDTVGGIFASPTELIAVELPPADNRLNLLPESWRQRRAQIVRQKEWRKRLILAGAVYAGILFFFFVYLLLLRLQVR